MRALSITALAFAAHFLLLPSCVQWQIGKSIRECAETRVGICPTEVYRIGEARAERLPETTEPGTCWDGRVCVAREARYEADSPIVKFHPALTLGGSGEPAQQVELTPHYRRVSFRYDKIGGLCAERIGERYDTTGQKMERDADSSNMWDWHRELNCRTMGCAEVERSKYYPLAVVAAAPFDYLIDPALSAVSSAAVTPIGVLCGAGVVAYFELGRWWHRPQPEETSLTPPEA